METETPTTTATPAPGTTEPVREKLTKKAITADRQVDRAVPCAMLNNL
jgi:hypothetical protein